MSGYKKPNLAALQRECDAFNAKCEVGGNVLVKLDGVDVPFSTTTRSEAQILSGHSAVVWMHNVSGCYLLSHVTPVIPLNLPGATVDNYSALVAATRSM